MDFYSNTLNSEVLFAERWCKVFPVSVRLLRNKTNRAERLLHSANLPALEIGGWRSEDWRTVSFHMFCFQNARLQCKVSVFSKHWEPEQVYYTCLRLQNLQGLLLETLRGSRQLGANTISSFQFGSILCQIQANIQLFTTTLVGRPLKIQKTSQR